jgi:hypothetical protein
MTCRQGYREGMDEGAVPQDGSPNGTGTPDGAQPNGQTGPASAEEAAGQGGEGAPAGAGFPSDLRDVPLPGPREFLLAVLILSNGVRRVADLDQRELADAVNTSPMDVRNAFRDLRAEGVISVSEDDWATLHLSASAWRRIAVAFADAVWALAPNVSWPPTFLAAAVLKAMGKVP